MNESNNTESYRVDQIPKYEVDILKELENLLGRELLLDKIDGVKLVPLVDDEI